jgi:hypothetical protein
MESSIGINQASVMNQKAYDEQSVRQTGIMSALSIPVYVTLSL